MRCFVVAGFLLTSASRGPSAIAEFLVIVLNVLCKVLILLTLDFNYIFTCLMWATVSALLCLVVRFYCYFIHGHFLLVL